MNKRFSKARQPLAKPSLSQWAASAAGEQAISKEGTRLAMNLQRAPGQRLLLLGGWFPSYTLGERWRKSATLPKAVDGAITLNTSTASVPFNEIDVAGMEGASSSSTLGNAGQLLSDIVVDGIALAEQLPLRNEELDVIVAPHLAEHCDDVSASIREAARVLRGGGWLMMTGFVPANPLAAMVSRQPGSGWVRRRIGPSLLRVMFAEEGFKVVLHECWSLNEAHIEKRWQWLPNFLQRLIQGKRRSYLIVAKKIVIPLTPDASGWFATSRPASRGIAAAGRTSVAPAKPTLRTSE